MPSFFHNITRHLYQDIAMAPVTAGTGDTQTGNVIDTAGFEAIAYQVSLGTLSAGAVTTIKLQEGNAANGSDMADVTGSSISVPQATGSNSLWWSAEVVRPTKRYSRVAVVRATGNAVINGANVVMARGANEPPVLGANNAGGNVAPVVIVSP
jgi:hypothetical protein